VTAPTPVMTTRRSSTVFIPPRPAYWFSLM
jgi:hypothetical protein